MIESDLSHVFEFPVSISRDHWCGAQSNPLVLGFRMCCSWHPIGPFYQPVSVVANSPTFAVYDLLRAADLCQLLSPSSICCHAGAAIFKTHQSSTSVNTSQLPDQLSCCFNLTFTFCWPSTWPSASTWSSADLCELTLSFNRDSGATKGVAVADGATWGW